MNEKKKLSSARWLWLFGATVLLLLALLAAFNFVMDPYGAFGDRFFQWWSYDETLNPRMAKMTYLEQHHDEYDSYIVGASGSSSYPVAELNEYLDASFYNCFFYGTEMKDFEELCSYLLENYTVKNLMLNLSVGIASSYDREEDDLTTYQYYKVDGTDPLLFYSRYLFRTPADSLEKLKYYRTDGYLQQAYRVFDAETGAYDKSKRDAEGIGDLDSYLQRSAYSAFLNYPASTRGIGQLDAAMESVARIKAMCAERGVNLIVTCQPSYYEAVNYYTDADLATFRNALAQITDYWDFTLSSVSYDPRYFYDTTHFRNSVGTMALARVFGNDAVYIPDDFGEYVALGSTPGAPEAVAADETDHSTQVPILMYHHLTEGTADNSDTVTVQTFAAQMEALADAGYHTVSFADLKSYVENGTALPENPVVLTFDDGYESNYTLAYPILQQYQFKATIFAIGVSVGKTTYKDTGEAMTPHFSAAEALEMEASGLIEVESHGYDIHEVEGRDESPIRVGILQREDESEADYVAFLQNDCQQMRDALGTDIGVLAYPYGQYDELSEVVLSQEGIYATVTTEARTNTVVQGLPQSLRQLGRYRVTDDMTTDDLLALLGN